MSAVSALLRDLYSDYKQGNNGRRYQQRQANSDGEVSLLATQSGRGDMVIAEHVEGETYAVIRVSPSLEGKSERNRRLATKPGASTDRQFQYCEYQLKRTAIPALRNGGGAQALHQACHWNRNTTSIRTAQSARQLVRDWEDILRD